jgi:hypothetical protein
LAEHTADAGTQGAGWAVSDDEVRDAINKRLTLNWLIQGAAQHAGMTSHHLVRNELDSIHPSLLPLYDQFALIILLQYWYSEAVLLSGWPPRFWRRAASKPAHPFFGHPVLSRHGGTLAAAAKKRAMERAEEKGLRLIPGLFLFKSVHVIVRLETIEEDHHQELIALAKDAAALVWGIPTDRLDGELTSKVAFGDLSTSQTLRGRILRLGAMSYGGVMRCDDSLKVVARARNFWLLTNELVKGTAELMCLHGINTLPDDVYQHVMHHADRIEFEPWMLQTGVELWRRLLAVLPDGRPMADMLMHLARLPAKSLESVMLAVIEQPERARELLAGLGMSDTKPNAAAGRRCP